MLTCYIKSKTDLLNFQKFCINSRSLLIDKMEAPATFRSDPSRDEYLDSLIATLKHENAGLEEQCAFLEHMIMQKHYTNIAEYRFNNMKQSNAKK